jgi:hypothetical protein
MCCKSWKASTAWTCRCTQTEDQMVGSPRRTNTKDNNLEPNSNYYILDHISTVLAFCTPCSAPEPESSYLPESLRRHPTSPQKPTNKPELRILSWLFSSRMFGASVVFQPCPGMSCNSAMHGQTHPCWRRYGTWARWFLKTSNFDNFELFTVRKAPIGRLEKTSWGSTPPWSAVLLPQVFPCVSFHVGLRILNQRIEIQPESWLRIRKFEAQGPSNSYL